MRLQAISYPFNLRVLNHSRFIGLCIVFLFGQYSLFSAEKMPLPSPSPVPPFIIVQSYTVPGNFSFTVPQGVTSITIEAWGGGGRGGSKNSGTDGTGGGGGGAYSREVLAVTPGESFVINVGAGSNSNSADGGDSWVSPGNIGQAILLAKGGKTVPNNGVTGGAGGNANEGIGSFRFSGGNGANRVNSTTSGGGGSSAGFNNAGNNANNQFGGNAPSGGGNGGNGRTAPASGLAGSAPGGGGGGAVRGSSGSPAGGNGAGGHVIITYTYVADAGEDQTYCDNGLFKLSAPTPPMGFTATWSVVSGIGIIQNANSLETSVSVPAGMNATVRLTVTDGVTTGTDDVVLTNLSSCPQVCTLPLNVNSDLENAGSATAYNLSFQGTSATLIQSENNPVGWSSYYGGNIPNTTSFTGAYYLNKNNANGNPKSGTGFIYLAGNGFGVSALEGNHLAQCGRKLRVSANVAAFSNSGTQSNATFLFAFEATGNMVPNYTVSNNIIAPASNSWNNLNWQRYSFEVTIPSSYYEFARIYFMTASGVNGIVIDDVCIEEIETGAFPLAGDDIFNCENQFSLSATALSPDYTGSWSVTGGNATITSPGNPQTTATITSGNVASLRWNVQKTGPQNTITLIDPKKEGGFENGSTFANNGWNTVNQFWNRWSTGASGGATSGESAAYISNVLGGGANSYINSVSQTVHFYRDVIIHPEATDIMLDFKWKSMGESGFDRILVYTAPTSVTPSAGVPSSPSTVFPGATLVSTLNLHSTNNFQTAQITLPNSLAGSNVRLIFTWQNDNASGVQPPAVIDEISLTHKVPLCNGYDDVVIGYSTSNFSALNDTICTGDTAMISATGCNNGTLSWSTGETTSEISVHPVTTTTYSVTCTPNIPSNILLNPGFESATDLQFWTSAGIPVAVTSDPQHVQEGIKAAVLNGTSGFTLLAQPVDVVPGDRYILKVWAKTGNTNANPVIKHQLYASGWSQLLFNEPGKKIISHDYEEYTIEFIIPPGAAHLLISAEINGGILYVDNWSLHRYIECVATADAQVVVNPLPVPPTVQSIVQPTCTTPTGSVLLSGLPAAGNWTITRIPGNVQYTASGATYTISGLAPDQVYQFSVTNHNGCTSGSFSQAVILPIPSDPVLSGDTITCVGTIAQVLPSAEGSWSSSNNAIATINNAGLVSGISPGNVILTYTRTSDGCDQTMLFDVFSNPATPFIGPVTQPTCTTQSGSVLLQSLPPSGNWRIIRLPDLFEYQGSGTSFLATGLPPGGNYTFYLIDEHGCISLTSANVAVLPVPSDPVIGGDQHGCVGAFAQVTPSSNGIWSSNDTNIATITNTGAVTGIASGNVNLTYTRTVDGCSSSIAFTVNDNPSSPTIDQITHPTCIIPTGSVILKNLPSGDHTITIFPGGQNYPNVIDSFVLSGLTPNTNFTVRVTDNKGCISALTSPFFILPIPTNPTLSGDTTVCIGSVAQVMPSTGGIWSSANTSIATITANGAVTGVGAGIVNLTYIRNIDGCQSTKSFEVYSNPLAPVIGQITQPTCIIPSGSVILSGLPETGTWTIHSIPAGYSHTGTGTQFTMTLLAPAGTYQFTVTDRHGCISVLSANVVINPIPQNPVLGGDTLVCVGANAVLTPSSNGVWTSQNPETATISSTGMVTGIASGIATLTFTRNADGCAQSVQLPVFDIPAFPMIDSIVQPTCITPSGSVTLGGLPQNGNWTITVQPGNTTLQGSGLSQVISNLNPDEVYHFTVRDFRGCESEPSSEVFILDIPEDPVIEGDNYVCIDATTVLSPNTGGVWFSNNTSAATVDSTGLVTGIAASEVTLTFTRTADGCSSELLFIVRPLPLAPGVSTITQPTCILPTGSVELIGLPSEGDWIIARSPGDTLYMDSGTGILITDIPPDETYTFSLVNHYNCLSAPSADVIILPIPENPELSGTLEICNGLETTVFPSSGGVWTSTDPLIATVANNGWVQAENEGEVTLTYTRNTDGCSSSLTFTVHPLPTADLIAPEVCQDSAFMITNIPLTGLPSFTYSWSGPNGFSTDTKDVVRYESFLSMNGMYTVTITDSRGCVGTESIVGVINPKPFYTVSITDVTVFNGSNGSINLTVGGGTPPFTYLWSTTATTEDISGLHNGLYTVTVTDSKNCKIFSQPEFSVGHPADCSGFRTQTQGGWGSTAAGGNPGSYRDANFAGAFPTGLQIGCNNTLTLTSSAAVRNYLPCGGGAQQLPAGHLVDPDCIGNVFTGQLIALTLSAGFDLYDPNFGASDENLINLRITSGPLYRMTVGQLLVEANNLIGGCGSVFSISQLVTALTNVNENYVDGKVTGNFVRCCQVNLATTGGTICSGNSINVSAIATNGIAPFTYQWSDGLGSGASKTVSPASTKTYTVTVTDDLGCTKTATVTVIVNPTPQVSINAPAVCAGATLELTPFVNNGTPAFTYSWTGPNGFTSIASIVARPSSTTNMSGNYFVTVTDSRGCTATSSINATVYSNPPTPLVGDVIQPLCVPPTGGIVLNGLPSSGTWTIAHHPSGPTYAGSGSSHTVTGLSPSTSYRFRVIDQYNCTSSPTSSVTIGPIPPAPQIGGNIQACVGVATYVDPDSGGSWLSSNPSVASVSNAGLVTAINPGTTQLTYTQSDNGCTNSMLYTVFANPTAPVIETVTQPTCYIPTGSVELSGLPNNSFWTVQRFPGQIPYPGSGTNLVISGLPIESSYTFRIINENFCTSPVSASAIVNGMPANPVLSGPPAICTGASTNFLPNSGGTWTSSNPAIATINHAGEVQGISPGDVTFTYVRLSDGCQNSITFTVHPNPASPLIGTITQPTCTIPTGSVVLSGLPENDTWTLTRFPGNVQTSGSGTSYTVNGLPPGETYTFIVRNGFICASEISQTVAIPDIPSNPVLSGENEICIGFNAQVFPDTGGTWTSSNPTIATINNGGLVTGIAAGLVTLTYTRDIDGCQESLPFNVRVIPAMPFVGTVIQPTCIEPTGSVTLSNLPSSGTWTLTMLPSNSTVQGTGSTYLWTGLAPDGNYAFNVASQFGCTSGTSAVAIVGSIPSNPVVSGDNEICIGETGQVFPSGNGVWTSSDPAVATVNSIGEVTGLSAGETELTYVRTIDGCQSSWPFIVNGHPATPVISSVTHPTCLVPFGSITIEGLPENGPWTIIRNPGNFAYQGSGPQFVIQQLTPTSSFTFLVIDAKTCSSNPSLQVDIQDVPSDPIISGDESVCVGMSIQLEPSDHGTWTTSNPTIANISNGGLVTGAAPGLVTLTYTRDADGCDAQKNVEVHENPVIPFLGTVTQPTCIEPSGKVLLGNLPSATQWTITIQPGGQVIIGTGSQYLVTNLNPDTYYTFSVTSEENCTSATTGSLYIQPIPGNPVLGGDELVCIGAEIQLTPSSGGTWLSNNTNVATITSDGIVTGAGIGMATMTFTRTDDGCTYSKVIEVKGLPEAPIAVSIIQPTCLVPSGSVQLQNLPSNGNWALTRHPGNVHYTGTGTSYNVSNLTPNQVLSFFVTDLYGCKSTHSGQVQINPVPNVPVLTGVNSICFGATSQLMPNTGGTWESSEPHVISVSNTGLVTPIEVGSAVLTYTRDADGCSNTMNFFANPNPVATISGQPLICEGGFGTLEAFGGVIFSWNTGASTPTLFINQSGLYSVTITNSFGCQNSTSYTVNVNPAMTADIDYQGSVCIGPDKEISAVAIGGTAPYQYNWTGPSAFAASTQSIIPQQNGNYYLTITDASGCIAVTQGFVHQAYDPLIVSLNTTVCEGSNVTLQVNSATAIAYQWSQNAGNAVSAGVIVTPSPPSSLYQVTVTNDLGCTAVPEIQIDVIEKPVISLDGPQSICVGDTTSFISNQTGFWHSIEPSVGSIDSNGMVIGIQEGVARFVFSTNNGNCFSDTSEIITVYEKPLALVVGPTIICESNYTELSPSIGGSWISSDPNVAIVDNDGNVLGLNTGIANFTYTRNSNGCISDPTQNITVTESLSLNIRGPIEMCKNTSILLRPNIDGGYWASSDTSLAIVNNSGIVTSRSEGLVVITYYYQTPNCIFFITHNITIHSLPTIAFTGNTELCLGETSALTAVTGGTWTSSNPAVATIDPAGFITALQAGEAFFTFLSDQTNCQSESSGILTVHALPFTELSGNDKICIGDTTQLSPSENGSWLSSHPHVAEVDGNGLVIGISAGSAFFTFTHAVTGCSATLPVEIQVVGNPSVTLDYNGSICLQDNSQLSAIVSGGTPGYVYTWSGPGGYSNNTQNIFISQNGQYTVSITDNNGCVASATGTVFERFEPVITGFNTSVCEGTSVSLTVQTNLASSYIWSSNAGNSVEATVQVTPQLPSSTYIVTVTNHIGCTVATQATIQVKNKPVVNITGPHSICIGNSTFLQPVAGGIWASINPGVASISNAGVVTGLSAGITRFIYTDNTTGCISDTSGIIVVNAPTAIQSNGPFSLCRNETVQLLPDSGGSWYSNNPSVASVNASGLVSANGQGVTLFTFINDAGCTSASSVSVTVHAKPAIVLNGPASICVETTTQFLPSTGGTWTSLSPTIATIQSNGTVTGVSEGNARFLYTYTLTGCVSDTSQIITVNDSVDILVLGSTDICIGNTTQLSPAGNGLWISNNPQIAGISPSGVVTGLQPGTATFTYISNGVQCFAGTSMPITIHALPTASLVGRTTLCIGDSTQVISNIQGNWVSSNPAVAQVDAAGNVIALSPGSAVFTITDNMTGCVSYPTNPVTVYSRPNAYIEGISTICEGSTTSLSPTTGGNWISTNLSVATVSGAGIVTGIQAGTAQFIFVESGSGCSSLPTNPVNVESRPSVSYAGSDQICEQTTTQLQPSTGGSWSSSNPDVATVDNNGQVTGIMNGISRFTFVSQNGCISEPTSWLTVHDKPQIVLLGNTSVCEAGTTQFLPSEGGIWTSSRPLVASINNQGIVTGITSGSSRFVFTDTITGCISDSTDLIIVQEQPQVALNGRAAICTGQTTNLTPTSGGQWISLNPTIAGINNNGQVNGLSQGVASFRFTSSSTGCSAELVNQVTVNAPPSISVNGPSLICTGSTTNLNPSSGGTWTALDPLIGSVSQSGIVTGLNAGAARFRFTDSHTGCISSSHIQIQVQSIPTISLNGPAVICIGQNTQLLPETGGIWISTDTTIATISNEGLVTGIKSGSAQFYFVSASNGCQSALSPVVNVHPDAMLQVSGSTDICIQYTTQLTTSTSGVWYSEDLQKATISVSGLVTALAPGKANFYFIESSTGCVTPFPRDLISITNCIDPDVNVTFISTPVQGNLRTNDEVPAGTVYNNNPVMVTKPEGAFASLTIQSNGQYSFVGNLPGQYRYLVSVCMPNQFVNCPRFPLTITVTDPNKMKHCLVVNTDLVSVYKNGTALLPVTDNDACINSTGCEIDPSGISIIGQPAFGTAQITANYEIAYVPALNFIGTDTVLYQVCSSEDANQCTRSRLVIVVKDDNANVSLSATDDFYFMNKNGRLDSLPVFKNDMSPEGSPFTVSPVASENNPSIIAQGFYYISQDGYMHFKPNDNYVGPVDIVYQICDTSGYCVMATAHILVLDNLKIKARTYLEGALVENGDQRGPDNRPLMRDGLRKSPFNNLNVLPSYDPYSYPTDNFDITENYKHVGVGALEQYRNIPNASQVFSVTGANAIVDWVFVELRSVMDSSIVLATRSGLLQRDGDIVDLDGVTDLEFPGIRVDSCYIVVRHRNHLDVMSSKVPTFVLMDFTKNNAPVFDFGRTLQDDNDYSGLALKPDVILGYKCMWAGDFDGNGKLKFINPNDDQNILFFEVLTHPSNEGYVANFNYSYGYFQGDVDLNGKIKYDNPDDDKNYLFYQILFHPLNTNFISNFNGIIQQVPEAR